MAGPPAIHMAALRELQGLHWHLQALFQHKHIRLAKGIATCQPPDNYIHEGAFDLAELPTCCAVPLEPLDSCLGGPDCCCIRRASLRPCSWGVRSCLQWRAVGGKVHRQLGTTCKKMMTAETHIALHISHSGLPATQPTQAGRSDAQECIRHC